MRLSRLVATALAGLVLAGAPRPASAEEPLPVSLSVEVPPTCPSDLAAQILARTPGTRVAREGERARRVGARIIEIDGRFQGAVALDGEAGRPVVRQVEAPSCEEVVAALALIAALAIDPDALTAPAPQAPPPPSPPPPPAPPAATPLAAQTTPPSPEPEAGALEVALAVEAGVGVATGLAPRAIAGGQLTIELGIPRRDPLVLVRGGVGYWTHGQIATAQQDAAATYRAVLARIDACVPVRIERFWGAPCATFDVGSLAVEGSVDGVITEGFEETQLWAAPGPALRLGWDAFGPWTVAVDGALTFPLRRDTYVFEEPAEVAHEVPAVAARSGFYVTLHFR